MLPAFRYLLFALLTLTPLSAQVSQTGQWTPLVNWPFIPVSVAHLADGRVLAWSSTQPTTFPAGATFTHAAIYDPTTGQITTLNHTSHDMFCAGLATTGDGRIIASGGGADVRTTSMIGMIPRWPQTWSRGGDMLSGRWYNSSVALPDGNLMTMWGRSGGTLTETFNQNTNTWGALPGISLSSSGEANDGVDDDNQWFPHLHMMPNGKILMAGPLDMMRWLDFSGTGSSQDLGMRGPDAGRHRKLGFSVQYLPGKVLMIGGRDDRYSPSVTKTALLIDATTGTPVVTSAPPMSYARAFHYAVMLPNGEVFVVGGNTSGTKFSDAGGVTVPEVWNPSANTWRSVAAMAVPRGYHMTALLLRDGRVMVGGGGLCGCVADHANTQIYSPGYLFNSDGTAATRPVIDLVSSELKPGLTIGLKGSDNITGFRLIRLQATTHGINSDQHYVPVSHAKVGAGNYSLTLDSSQNVLLPGMYWLFGVTASGTPSIGYPVQMFTPATWPGGTGGETNLAKNKPATQSSTDATALASRAVDGNTNGDFAAGSVTHTALQAQPYWLTDLGANAMISGVRIWNRTDCCANRLANFHVFFSDTPITGTTVAEVKAQAGVLDIPFPGTASTTTTLAVNRSGRYVRIQLEGTNYLSLAEVEVLGRVITNQAPTVSLQSPVTGASAFAPATFAISATAADPDGNLARVEFYQGATKLGEATAAPFTYTWANVPTGAYTVTARAVDALGLFAEASVNVSVNPPVVSNRPPVISISSPLDGSAFTAPAGVSVSATASDPDGNLLKVEYFQGAVKLGESAAAPFAFSANNLDAGNYTFSAKATDTLGLTATATINVRVLTRQLQSLKGVPVPEPSTLTAFVKNRAAAIALGKALFWDLQVSSDGTVACASCHFQAGADVRLKNQMNPGTLRTGSPSMTFDASRTGSVNGPNYVAQPGDFPRHVLSNPSDPNSTVVYQSKDVMGSHGVVLRNYTSAAPGAVEDACVATTDPVFGASRRSTGRNAPTVLNAIFNVRNFWDGRANSTFNGVDSLGPRNTAATIFRGTPPVATTVALDNASLASQAVTAPLNSSEMSCAGRTWPEIGKRLLTATVLARQNVSLTDSTLGGYAVSGTKGLNRNYDAMVRAAFFDDLHSSATPVTVNGKSYSQIQANFSLFFGLAVQMYEATLVSDQAPIDSYFSNYPSTAVNNASSMTSEAIAGMNVFNGKGRCVSCHHGPQLTNAATPAREAAAIGALISRMRMANGEAGAYDLGYYNLGVRPAGEDLGIGGLDEFGNPLSFSRQAKAGVLKDGIAIDSCTFEMDPCIPLNGTSRDVVDGAFKTPTLRNISLTGPYFHNGSVATLEDVVEFYDRGGNATGTTTSNSTGFGANTTNSHADIRPLALTAFEKTALVTFLKTALVDDRVLYERAPFDHPDLPLVNGQTGANSDLVLVPAVGSAGRAQPVRTFDEILAAGDLGLPAVSFPVAPTVALTAPVGGVSYFAPATISLTATASITQGSVSQVEFYEGTNLLGIATAAPYVFNWSNVVAGTYTLTAKAIGSGGLSATSGAVTVSVVTANAPTVSLTAPSSGAGFVAPASISLTANASTTQGTVASVEFYSGTTLLGAVSTAPYGFNWTNVPAGSYSLTAKAIGSNGASASSVAVPVTVTAPVAPTVAVSSPANGAAFVAPATISIAATATTTQGTVTKVEFFNGASLLGTATAAPYSFNWTAVGVGSYSITATAYGSNGTTKTSVPVSVSVGAAVAPTVLVTAPGASATFTAPAAIAITATASTTQGTIASVEFYNGASLLGSVSASPYTFNWANVAAGTYSLTAKAIGSNGMMTTSVPVSVTVSPATTGAVLAGRWQMDSVTSGVTPDNSGNSNPGTVSGPYSLVPGKSGSALQLDASVGGVVTQRSAFDVTKSFSVSAWVNLTSTSGTQTFVSLPAGQVSNFYLQLGGWLSGGFVFDLYPSDSTAAADFFTESAMRPVPNTWYLVTGVYDATAKQVRIYVNGQLENQAAAPTGSFANAGPLAFGYSKWNGNRADGNDARLDDVRVFGSALTSAEVLAMFNETGPSMTAELTSPVAGASFVAPASVTLSATASTTTGSIASVEFYNGVTLLGTATTAPYNFAWANVAAGSYTLTAKAIASGGQTVSSSPVNISVTSAAAPLVSITAPVAGAGFVAPATVAISATATTTQGTITKVEFYNGATLLGTDTTSPYAFSWANVTAGTYAVTAVAYGSNGTTTTSAQVSVVVSSAAAPLVSITAPVAGASFVAPATVAISATATTTQGTITKVEFFNGATLLGTDTTSPYAFSWANVAAGTYAVTAKATGSNGTTTTSAPVSVVVSSAAAPLVSIAAPVAGASFVAPATVAISATATTAQGTITKVEFFNGATLLGTDTTSPYAFSWANVAAGTYAVTAKATGSNGTTTTSAPVSVVVSSAAAPLVSIAAPVAGASFVAPATVAISATATTAQGTITKVEFYNGATLLGTDTTSPYAFSWANVAAGTYAVTAKATGSNGTTTTSAPVSVVVSSAAAPLVSITAPVAGASFVAPATVAISATATTTQGTITKVEFYNGATLLGTDTTSPYAFSWANVAAGTYAVTAKAFGSNGLATTSAAVAVTVNPAGGGGPIPVGRWPLDSVTSGVTADTSGNANNGVVSGPFTVGAGTVGQSLQLDASVGGVVTQRPVLDPTKSFTVSAWVNLTNTAGTQTFVSMSGGQVSNFYLQLGGWANGGFIMDLYPNDSTASVDYWAESTTRPVANTWYHLAGVYDATAQQVRIYVNGVLEKQVAAPSGSFANSTPLVFGYAKWAGNRADGNNARIDDVRAFNTALTTAEIQSVFAAR